MPSSNRVLARMSGRVNDLAENLTECLHYFDSEETFVGPSIYFHHKTLETRAKHKSIKEVILSDDFYDWLYATLTAWGMHRMGKGNTRLRDIQDIKISFRSLTDKLVVLGELKLSEIPKNDIPELTATIWGIISNLRVSIAEAKIVANTKALHHLLPDLVPPIDRTYTYSFFYDRTGLSLPEQEAFQEIYPQLAKLARTNNDRIQPWIGKGFHASETKIIDNAIIGYVRKNLNILEEGDE